MPVQAGVVEARSEMLCHSCPCESFVLWGYVIDLAVCPSKWSYCTCSEGRTECDSSWAGRPQGLSEHQEDSQ